MDDAAQTESDLGMTVNVNDSRKSETDISFFLGMHYSDVDKHFEEARQRALNALKTSFSKQRNKGLLSDEAVTVLRQAVDSVQNDPTSCQECFLLGIQSITPNHLCNNFSYLEMI